MTLLQICLILMVVNYILDFPFQGFFLAEYKSKNWYVMFVHCMIWAGGLACVLMFLGLFAWWKFIMLFIGHVLIDTWKCKGYYKQLNLTDWQSLYVDQILHLLQIGLCLI